MAEMNADLPQSAPSALSTSKPALSTSQLTSLHLVAGGIAGTTVDVVLFPLDTIKTRMQSAQGFWKAGGFKGIYSGLASAAAGSAPGAALFFSTYEFSKKQLLSVIPDEKWSPLAFMGAASVGEAMACLVRVPTENIKQKMQAGLYTRTSDTVRGILAQQGPRGFYTGYSTTMMREVPFAVIQFPIYERLKKEWLHKVRASKGPEAELAGWQAALCGSFSGGLAAGLTTPMDVVKTRMMLAGGSKGQSSLGPLATFRSVYAEGGVARLFAGVGPRVMWISIGGSVFFGVYEKSKSVLTALAEKDLNR